MQLFALDDQLWFPPVSEALPDGLLAIGGDLNIERLILAYQNGIFPWYASDLPLWWCPDPRFVLFPNEIIVSKSMKTLLRNNAFEFSINKNFKGVIEACSQVERKEQDGTWLSDEMKDAYIKMHELGYAFSAETWYNGELVGGLYGIWMGNIFFGESMFADKSNASKFAFIKWVEHLKQNHVKIIDCQVYTEHLESLGARMINREKFLTYLPD